MDWQKCQLTQSRLADQNVGRLRGTWGGSGDGAAGASLTEVVQNQRVSSCSSTCERNRAWFWQSLRPNVLGKELQTSQDVHSDSCPPVTAPTDTWASEPDHGAVEEGGLCHMDGECVRLRGDHTAPGCIVGRQIFMWSSLPCGRYLDM